MQSAPQVRQSRLQVMQSAPQVRQSRLQVMQSAPHAISPEGQAIQAASETVSPVGPSGYTGGYCAGPIGQVPSVVSKTAVLQNQVSCAEPDTKSEMPGVSSVDQAAPSRGSGEASTEIRILCRVVWGQAGP